MINISVLASVSPGQILGPRGQKLNKGNERNTYTMNALRAIVFNTVTVVSNSEFLKS